MIEWWQAIAFSVAGSALGLGGAFVQRLWSNRDAHDAEDREDRRRVEAEEREARRLTHAEEREARRQHRRERVDPVLDFLDMVQRFLADTRLEATGLRLYEQNVARIQDFPKDKFMQQFRGTEPTIVQIGRAYTVAFMSVPTDEIKAMLDDVFSSTASGDAAEAVEPMRRMEQAMEDFLAGG